MINIKNMNHNININNNNDNNAPSRYVDERHTSVCEKTLLSRASWLCTTVAETPLQPLIWWF